jgi:predicted amidophosphoribosyltransferase
VVRGWTVLDGEVPCVHGRLYGECFVCMMAIAAREHICEECGNDLVCEGFRMCSDCLEKFGE